MLKRLIPEERIGIGLALVALALGLAWATLYQRFWILSFLPWLLFFIVLIGFALGRGIDAVKDRDLPSNIRWRKGLAIPLIVGGVLMLDTLTERTFETSARLFLWTHQDELDAAEPKAGPGRPVALQFIQGVPDGGVAMIRSKVDPTRLDDGWHRWLVSEPINECRKLRGRDWLCWFD